MNYVTELTNLLNDHKFKRFDFIPLFVSTTNNSWGFDYIIKKDKEIFVIFMNLIDDVQLPKINVLDISDADKMFIYNVILNYKNIKNNIEYS